MLNLKKEFLYYIRVFQFSIREDTSSGFVVSAGLNAISNNWNISPKLMDRVDCITNFNLTVENLAMRVRGCALTVGPFVLRSVDILANIHGI